MHKTKTFTKGDQTLVIVGNMHVMPSECWDDIKSKLDPCDIVLCEGVMADSNDFLKPLADVKRTDSKLSKLYQMFAECIEWVDQSSFYKRISTDPKFVACDTSDNVVDPIGKKIEALIERLGSEEEAAKAMSSMKWLIKFMIKHALFFSRFAFFSKKFEFELITKRNHIVISAITTSQHKKIGVLYGLGHLKHLESLLLNLGWNKPTGSCILE